MFARGTTEPPGLGSVGRPFVDDLRARVAPRSVEATAVDYPASNDFAQSTPAGIDAARSVIESTAANCPKTKMVLGGYSQGAAVIEGATSAAPQYVANSIDQCAQADPICWEGGGFDPGAHGSYVQSGKVTQAADFAASKI